MFLSVCNFSYLGREGVAVDAVLGAAVVPQAVVNVYLLELVPVGQRAARHVDVMSCRVLHSEHDTVPRVADTAAHLRQHNGTSVLVLHVMTHR